MLAHRQTGGQTDNMFITMLMTTEMMMMMMIIITILPKIILEQTTSVHALSYSLSLIHI